MSSKAYDKFRKTLNRCESLLDSYRKLRDVAEQEDAPPASKDIVRGAVVLAVSALDAYVTDVFAEKLVSYLKTYEPDEALISLLNDAGLDTEEALTMISMDRPYQRVRTLIRHHYLTHTTQQVDVIDEMFLPYRLKNLTDNAEKKAGRKTLCTSVQKLVKKRNQIAHSGDYNAHGRIRSIDEEVVERRMDDMELLVKNMDDIICNRI